MALLFVGWPLLAGASFATVAGLLLLPRLSGPPNKRLKLTARVDCGMSLSSARRSLSAIVRQQRPRYSFPWSIPL